ncbi:MAG: CBS domain-containing protein [Bacteroidia bacterium]|nr:CBS domain-containing protein [Bacteroidia bacterium]MBT8309320.1 CBS domain-containing protein [Bacteroidia bacterium]NND09847.1 CBS domain-containing protein [Flavobacteriaceae bacterium]NNK28964.1 CBS domain-containing protein [Flavobacteriaceae bacterium]NNL60731.1 CBS domain-containing protein [Flavobacteriaceae bacterium]
MTKNVVSVSPGQKILDVKHIYEKKDFHHHIPVTENGKLVGMISLVDFMYKINGAGLDDNNAIYSTLSVKDIMTTHPYTMNSDVTIEEVARVLSKGDYHAIPIVEDDRIVGIVSTADVIRFFIDQ